MSKQLLIYSRAQAVSSQRHREWSVKTSNTFEFAKEVNSVPLTAIEFMAASTDYPIVFAGSESQLMPVAVMGVRENENLFIAEDGSLDASYSPAFLRRYPFVFSTQDGGKNFTLCVDETFSGCNQENLGERLFDAEGEKTTYLNGVLEFLKDYQTHFVRTQAFCKKLQELELVQPMGAQFTTPSGDKLSLTGFYTVDRQKLKELPAEELQQLVKNDGLELIYLHLHSMRNLNGLLARVGVKADKGEDA